MIKSYRIWC